MKNRMTNENSRRARWMIVDDNEAILTLLSDVGARLEDVPALECFKSPGEAIAAFATNPDAYDFVLTDRAMPDTGDDELSRRLRALSPILKIFLSLAREVFSDEEAAQKGFCEMRRRSFPLPALQSALKPAALRYSSPVAGLDHGLKLVCAN